MSEDITVIVPTIGRVEVLRNALQSLVAQTVAAEIVVIDQNPGRELGEIKHQFGERCTWARMPAGNLPGARNLGANLALGSVLVFCDDDIEAPPHYLAHILARYRDARWGAVCGPSIASEASWNARPPIRDIASDEAYWRGNFQSSVSMEVRAGMGCNHSVRTHWWRAAGGYDEAFGGGALREESEFFVRLTRLGCRVYYDAACWVYHPRGDRSGGCAGIFRSLEARAEFRQRLAAHAYFAYKSFPGRAGHYMRKELFSLLLRRHGLRSLVRDPGLIADWFRINRSAARRFGDRATQPSPVRA